MALDEEKQKRLYMGEEITLSVEEYVIRQNLSPDILTPQIQTLRVYRMRELWTKESSINILYDLIYDK